MTTIQDYKLSPDETEYQALWKTGVYSRDSDGLITYQCAYLRNGRCANCGRFDHPPHCPGGGMKTIVNLVFPTCAVCKVGWIDLNRQVCYRCSDAAEECSCWTPDYCEQADKHNKEYYAKKRAEWKAKLTALGIPTDT